MTPEPGMLDFHVHTTLSDGELIPSELFRRAKVKGIDVLGLADHTDFATTSRVIEENLQAVLRERETEDGVTAFCGVELTHVHPIYIAHLAETARQSGAEYVIVHGETPTEPVEPGTNRAAIEAGCDYLAHPGLITDDDAALAAERGVLLEISSKAGHSLANGHVAKTALKHGANLIYGSDTHSPEGLYSHDNAFKVLLAAGLTEQEAADAFENARGFYRKLYKKYVEEARDA